MHPHVIDVLVGPLRGRHAAFDCRILSRHAKRVPTHRLQDMFAAHALVAGDDVADRKNAHMPHVQFPAWIREHCQAIELVFALILGDLKTS